MGSAAARHVIRRDIEGLRALAVLAVVVNHLLPAALGGGFCGVDIFFVISGYLIGMHLLQDIQAGQFSFLKFYARRARRLLPALVIVLTATWCCGWVVLTTQELAQLGKHIAAATVFANNLLLASESGYFDAPSSTKPLLHLWSLGVEEQFYLLVPLLLWLGARGGRVPVRWALWLSVGSLLVTVCAPLPSFYLLHTRFWELGVGVTLGYLQLRSAAPPAGASTLGSMSPREILACASLLMLAGVVAYASQSQPWRHGSVLATSGLAIVFALAGGTALLASASGSAGPWQRLTASACRHERLFREASGVVGFAVIGLSLVAMTSADWPGPQTVLPVLGTALVIAAGPAGRLNRLLGLRPLVFLGAISYPLYLWHWPIIVFDRLVDYGSDLTAAVLLILAAVLLAWWTRDLIENPARFGRLWGKAVGTPPIWVLACGLIFTGLLGASAVATHGYPTRYSPALHALANSLSGQPDYRLYRLNECYLQPGASRAFAPECTPPRRLGVPQILLWGDSHAAHLYPGVLGLQKQHDFELLQWTAAGCPPVRTHWVAESPGCAERRAWELSQLTRSTPDTVLLAARWDLYLSGGISQEEILAGTLDDIQWLRHLGVHNIVLFGPGPTWNVTLATDLVRSMRMRHVDRIPERLGRVPHTLWRLDAAMAAQAAALRARYVSLLRFFCDREGCRTVGERQSSRPDLLFFDSDHLTVSGSRLLVEASAAEILAR